MTKWLYLLLALSFNKFFYLHSIFTQDILVAAEINIFGEMLWKLSGVKRLEVMDLRRNPPDVGVTSGQKPSTKIIYIVLQTSVGLF